MFFTRRLTVPPSPKEPRLLSRSYAHGPSGQISELQRDFSGGFKKHRKADEYGNLLGKALV